jgi:hypothetical protein
VKFRDKILGVFPHAVRAPLLEFNKYISHIDADFIVFMARKSLRLHDLLLAIGGENTKKQFFSDHIFDQDLRRFKGKRIALIDDTLILGTTLGRVQQNLLNAGALEVSTHVFCVDKVNWCSDLVIPDKIFLEFEPDEMLTFCAAEVQALAICGIPYLSDFPISEPAKFSSPKLAKLQSLFRWEVHTLTTPRQDIENAFTYSYLPRLEVIERYTNVVGDVFIGLIDILKVRVFGRKVENSHWLKFVPIVTLKPVHEDTVDEIFIRALNLFTNLTENNKNNFSKNLSSSISKIQFIQYVLSSILGQIFSEDVREATAKSKALRLDSHEAVRHLGVWLQNEICVIHQELDNGVNKFPLTLNSEPLKIAEAPLPPQIVSTSIKDFDRITNNRYVDERSQMSTARNLLTDMTRIFVEFYRTHELPARNEAKKFGCKIYDVDYLKVPHINRLRYGFAWRVLVERLVGKERSVTDRRASLLSLILDSLIDMGIAVPILVHQEGVLFRAYRHGEDVLFGEQEIALSHDAVVGFLKGADKAEVTRIAMEKLITSLIRVGVARGFMEEINGQSGSQGMARIGYNLHGSVPFFPKGNEYIADDKNSWLSDYMVDRGVFKRNEKGRYTLGKRPEAALRQANANTEANQLGWLIGKLYLAGQFSDKDFIVLASCISPKDTAAALAVETDLIRRWADRELPMILSKIDSEKPDTYKNALRKIVSGYGYTAMNSARLKLIGFKEGKPKVIVQGCEEYLRTLENGDFLAAHWNGCWHSLISTSLLVEQFDRFDSWIDKCSSEIFSSALCVFSIELGLVSAIEKSDSQKHSKTRNKVVSYIEEMTKFVNVGGKQSKLANRLIDACKNEEIIDPSQSIEYGKKEIRARIACSVAITNQCFDVVRDYGKNSPRTNFSQVIWYDIIDSTGQKSGYSGEELKSYRERVSQFKAEINKDIIGLRYEIERNRGLIHPSSGHWESKDDEKYLFLTGRLNQHRLEQIIQAILGRCEVHDVRVRLVAIPADFAGIAAHKYQASSAVEGQEFWEYFSRLGAQLKDIEISSETNPKGSEPLTSFFWIAGELNGKIDLKGSYLWPSQEELNLITNIGDVPLSTRVTGGALKTKEKYRVKS